MTYKTTKSEILGQFGKAFTFSVGYCQLQTLLKRTTPTGYTCGVYGWNADIYTVGSCAIATGYRPFGKSISYELCATYENKARKVMSDRRFKSYEARTKKLEALILEFCQKAIAE